MGMNTLTLGFTIDENVLAANPDFTGEQVESVVSAHLPAILTVLDEVDESGALLRLNEEDAAEQVETMLSTGLHWLISHGNDDAWTIPGTGRKFVVGVAAIDDLEYTFNEYDEVRLLVAAATKVPAFGRAFGFHGEGVVLD